MIRTQSCLPALALMAVVAVTPARIAAASPDGGRPAQHPLHVPSSPPSLVDQVREATAIFRDVRRAVGYEPFGGCVSGPEEGAMGVHFVNPALLFDGGQLKVDEPEALIYEVKDGRARLVGVEYIVLASDWDGTHVEPPAPAVLEGQLFHFNESPNRFRLPAFYELHVWAWRDNPNGTYADWNTRVSCDGQ